MESVEVAKIKPGQSLTLTFREKEAILTKEEEPAKFKVEDWYPEEREIYLLDPVIAVDEILHYALNPVADLAALQEADKNNFGVNRQILDFMGRPVEEIASDDLEEEEEEDNEDEAEGD